MRLYRFAMGVAGLTLAACGSDSQQGTSGSDSTAQPPSGGSQSDGQGAAGAGGSAGGGGSAVDPTQAGELGPLIEAPAVAPGGGSATVQPGTPSSEDSCDGVDNDGNGIIDDVDVGMDGICDCLLIATLGQPGEWGNGDIFATWLASRSANGAADLAQTTLTAETLAPYHVIVAQDLRLESYSAEEINALVQWVDQGGGLMTLIGYGDPSERDNVNELLSPFELSYEEQPILPRQNGVTVPVTGWSTHPVTDGVDRVGADNGYPVLGGAQTVLLATEQGHEVGRAVERGLGHVVAWGDEWITYDSEWVDHPDYQVELFWVNAIKWLTRADACQVDVPQTIPRSSVR